MAAAILASAVLAVTWAVTAGQQQAEVARQNIVATLKAEERMGAVSAMPYNFLPTANDATVDGEFFVVTMIEDMGSQDITPLGVKVGITTIEVIIYDLDGKVITRLTQVVPAPPV